MVNTRLLIRLICELMLSDGVESEGLSAQFKKHFMSDAFSGTNSATPHHDSQVSTPRKLSTEGKPLFDLNNCRIPEHINDNEKQKQ